MLKMKIDTQRYISRASNRNWWLVGLNQTGNNGCVWLGNIIIPERFIGKRVRFKIEIVEDIVQEEQIWKLKRRK